MKYILFVLLAVFLISCTSKGGHEASSFEYLSQDVFKIRDLDIAFETATDVNQWEIILSVVESDAKNRPEVKEWLKERLEEKIKRPRGLDAHLLFQLLSKLNSFGLFGLGKDLAYYTLNLREGAIQDKERAEAILLLSNYFLGMDQIDSTIKYHALLSEYVDKEVTDLLKITYYINNAEIEESKGNFFKAVVNNQKAIALTDKSNAKNLSTLYHNQALIYLNMEFVEKSYEYINLSVEQVGIENYPINMLQSLAVIQSKFGQFEEAERSFKKIIDTAIKDNLPGLLARAYANYGNLKRKEGKFREAIEYIEKSDSLCLELDLSFGSLVNKINLSEVHYDSKNFKLAKEGLLGIQEAIEEIKSLRLLKEYYHLFYKVCDGLGESEKANQYYRLYNEKRNAYFGDSPKSVIGEWELSNERAEKQKVEADLELQLERNNRNTYFFLFFLALFLLVGALFYFYHSRKDSKEKERLLLEKQKLAFELELKSKEQLSDTLRDISVAHAKKHIVQELESLVQNLPKALQAPFLKLMEKSRHTTVESLLEEFNARFSGIYEKFFADLNEIAPDLTPNEINICAMIRLNLTTKDIAALTNKSLGTIENNRISIRKKLGLKGNANLQEFILKL